MSAVPQSTIGFGCSHPEQLLELALNLLVSSFADKNPSALCERVFFIQKLIADWLLCAAVEGQCPRIASTHLARGQLLEHLPQQAPGAPVHSALLQHLRHFMVVEVSALIWDAFQITFLPEQLIYPK